MPENDVLCVIPARGGSKGIPKKNIKAFCHKPLFIWSIYAALESTKITSVVVSSDCAEVKSVFDRYKFLDKKRLVWLDRPESISLDSSSTEEAIVHAIKSAGKATKYVVTLQPTSPIRRKGMIDDALNKITDSKRTSLMSVKQHTPFFVLKQGDQVKWLYNPNARKMRQELSEEEMLYHDDGNLYITECEFVCANQCRLDSHPYLYINDVPSSMQIDTQLDFDILQKMKQEILPQELYI